MIAPGTWETFSNVQSARMAGTNDAREGFVMVGSSEAEATVVSPRLQFLASTL